MSTTLTKKYLSAFMSDAEIENIAPRSKLPMTLLKRVPAQAMTLLVG